MTATGTISDIELTFLGRDLRRPECVLCTSDGSIYTSNWDGGVTRLFADGSQAHILAIEPPVRLQPNGIALLPDRSFLLANLGTDGGVWRMAMNGQVRPYLLEIEGQALEPANFVHADGLGRTWITVSTRQRPRSLAYRSDVADGYIVLVDDRGARVVADQLGYTNEVQLHPSGQWLYVNETFARRLSRFPIADDGSLGSRETVAEFPAGTFPDGLCFDETMGIWVVSIVSNRVIRIDRDGEQSVVLDGGDADYVTRVEKAYERHAMKKADLADVGKAGLDNVSSIAFSGPDRKRALLGCLLGDRLVSFWSPVAGIEPAHWNWCLPKRNR